MTDNILKKSVISIDKNIHCHINNIVYTQNNQIVHDIIAVVFMSDSPSEGAINMIHNVISAKCNKNEIFNLYFDFRKLNPVKNIGLASKQRNFKDLLVKQHPDSVKKVAIVTSPILSKIVETIFGMGGNNAIKSELESFSDTKSAFAFVSP